jgi:hypothetical protein
MGTPEVETLIAEIERQLALQDFQRAYDQWQQLRQIADSGAAPDVDLKGWRRRIEAEARAAREALIAALEAQFNTQSIDQFDVEAAERSLDALQNASLADDIADYESYRGRFESKLVEKRRYTTSVRVRREVEDEWNGARRLAREQRDIAVSALLEYYTRALEKANEAVGRDPANPWLQNLATQAAAEREKFASEEEVMTSGGQTNDFVRVLDYIERRENDDTVMVYDIAGNPIRRFPKDQARAEVIKNAKPFVKQKTIEYSDAAQNRLNALDPRAAATALQQFDKFVRLAELAPEVMTQDTRSLYNRLRDQTNAGLDALGRAETLAEKARDLSTNNLLMAWESLIQALQTYAGAFHSDVVGTAIIDIASSVDKNLRKQSDLLSTTLESRDFGKAQAQAEDLVQTFGFMDDLDSIDAYKILRAESLQLLKTALRPVRDALNKIRAQQGAATEGVKNKATISERLKSIRDKAARQPTEATKELDSLIAKFGAALVSDDTDYKVIERRVRSAGSEEQLLQSFREILNERSIESIEQARREVEEQSRDVNDKRLQQQYIDLARQLGYRRRELEAERILVREGHENALKWLRDLLSEVDPKTDMQERIQSRYNVLENDFEDAKANRERFKEMQRIRDNEPPEKAIPIIWDGLQQIERFTGSDQQREWIRLLGSTINILRYDQPFNLVTLDNLLGRARDINSDQVERWKARLDLLREFQRGRDAEAENRLDAALKIYTKAKTNASGEEQEYATNQVLALEKQIIYQNISKLVNRLPESSAQVDDLTLGEMFDMVNLLRKKAAEAVTTIDKLDYQAWAIELHVRYAQASPTDDPPGWERMLREIGESSTPLARTIRAYEQSLNQSNLPRGEIIQLRESVNNHRDMVIVSKAAPLIAAAIRNINLYINKEKEEETTTSSDVGLFRNAVRQWHSSFYESAPGTPFTNEEQDILLVHYSRLITWFNQRVMTVQESLRDSIRQGTEQRTAELSPRNLIRYAKLLALNPEDEVGRRVLDQLRVYTVPLQNKVVALIHGLGDGQGYESDAANTSYPASSAGNNITQRLSSGWKVLRNQQEVLDTQIRQMRLIAEIAKDFQDDLQEKAIQVSDACNRYSTLLDKFNPLITSFRQAAQDFEGFLTGYGLNETNFNSVEADIAGQFNTLDETVNKLVDQMKEIIQTGNSDLKVKLERLSDLPTNHPLMKGLGSERDNLINHASRIVETFRLVQEYAEKERFQEAENAIHDSLLSYHLEIQALLYERSTMQQTYFIRPATQSPPLIRGWESVKKWVAEQFTLMQCILAWADSLSVTYSPEQDALTCVTPEPGVVGWAGPNLMEDRQQWLNNEEERQQIQKYMDDLLREDRYSEAVSSQIQYLIMGGDFEGAGQRLTTAVSGKSVPGGLQCLEGAQERANQFPLADQGCAITTNFEEAISHAGSLRGQAYLRQVEQCRTQEYKSYLEAAERLRKEIDLRALRWQQLIQEFSDRLQPVSQIYEKLQGFSLLGHEQTRRSLAEAIRRVDETLKAMQNDFPFHSHIPRYRQHQILVKARIEAKNPR